MEITTKCRTCDSLEYEIDDKTEAWDCGSRLKGRKDIRTFFFCEKYPNGIQPYKCGKED